MADPIDTGKKTVTGRTIWRDPETGEDYSERSTTFEIDGKYYTMPTVAEDGTQYTEDQIRDYVKKYGPTDFITGEELPEFKSEEDAIEYAISRSDTRKQKEEPMLEEQMEMFNEGGLKDQGGTVDPESGNDVPIGSTKKEVRDDIPAMLSEGEFVLPADVVRYIGLENLMRLRQDAKMGLKQMEAMGQMGNSDEATLPDDMPFGPTDIIILGKPEEDEPKEMNQGGFATGIGGYQPSVYQGQPLVNAPVIPPSSIAPPPPAASPAGGYMPKFMGNQTTATDNSLIVNNQTTSTTNTGTTTSTPTTDDTKFVPTVEDAYKSIKYINKETGEIRDFFFYQGSPVTPIPEGFVPYNETTDEVVDDLESTQVDTATVRDTGGGGRGTINIPQPEKVDWSTYSDEELQDAYDKNRKTRMALTAMGAINPLIALFGQGATRMQEKDILKVMEDRGIKPPEVKGGIFNNITKFVSGLFGTDEKEVVKTLASGAPTKSLRPKARPEVDENIDVGPAFSKDAFGKIDLSDSERFGFPDIREGIDLGGRFRSDKSPQVQTDIVAGLGSQSRSTEDTIERQREVAREAAAAERRKDRRREKRKAEAKKAADKRKAAVKKAKDTTRDRFGRSRVTGKGAKAVSATQKAGAFAKGGLASRTK